MAVSCGCGSSLQQLPAHQQLLQQALPDHSTNSSASEQLSCCLQPLALANSG